jgi:rhodanese-related sulfurtransferase
MKIQITILLIAIAAIFAGCQKMVVNETSENTIKQISVAEAQTAVKSKDAQFIDVRTDAEYKSGHAPQTVNLPLDSLENEVAKLDKQKPVYVICQTGRRSQKGAEILQKNGFKEIYNVEGGTTAWANAGLPVDK